MLLLYCQLLQQPSKGDKYTLCSCYNILILFLITKQWMQLLALHQSKLHFHLETSMCAKSSQQTLYYQCVLCLVVMKNTAKIKQQEFFHEPSLLNHTYLYNCIAVVCKVCKGSKTQEKLLSPMTTPQDNQPHATKDSNQ